MLEYPIPDLEVSVKVYSTLKETRNRLATIYDYDKEELSRKKREKLEEIIKIIDRLLKEY